MFRFLCLFVAVIAAVSVAVNGATVSPMASSSPPATTSAKPEQSNGQDPTPEDNFNPQKRDHSQFDWQLTKTMFANNQQNVILSPISVKLLLTLLKEASGDDTKTQDELVDVIPFGHGNFISRTYFRKFFESLKDTSEDYTLDMVTRIFADKFTAEQRFSSVAQHHYETPVCSEDFSKAADLSQGINYWVSNVTHGHIRQLVKPADLENAVMLMVNAIYFKGLWRQPFFENQTLTSTFNTRAGPKQTPFMSQTGDFFYVHSPKLQAQILRLPYKGQKFAMYIVLPNSAEDFDGFVNSLDSAKVHEAKWLMDENEVRVFLPKFKFDYSANLNQVLQNLGVREVFTDAASLPGFARGEALGGRLKVSNIIQKAGLAVDEKGSLAFAATEVALVNKFGGDSTVDFKVDRPFVFWIEDEVNKAILFSGKVVDPTM